MKGSEKFALRMNLWRCFYVAVVQFLSCILTFATPWTAARQASLSFTISQSLLKLMSTESVMPSNQFILCHTLLLPSTFPRIGSFSSEPAFRIRWLEYWNFSFSFSISPTIGYSRLISLPLTGFISLQSKGLSRVFPVPQFKSVSSLVLSLLWVYPALTSICDHWKNHSFD